MLKRIADLSLALIVAHHVMVLLHEWAHSTAAWLMGLKPSPFHIHYGDWTLFHADEDLDYEPLLNSEAPWKASVIAASALIVNVLRYMASLRAMAASTVRGKPLPSQLAFWSGLRLPPWGLFVPLTPLVTWQVVHLLNVSLPSLRETLGINPGAARLAYGALVPPVLGFGGGTVPRFRADMGRGPRSRSLRRGSPVEGGRFELNE